ncbi:MAG: hypothetical protein L3K00_08315 [Thermoplasmata archaeon]|nr:hypothetical protein [Thermoplasmata archaeon]
MNSVVGWWDRSTRRRRSAVVAVFVAALVATAGAADLVYQVEAARTVTVTDVLGVAVVYASTGNHDLGGPVCANCPVATVPDAHFVVTVWIDWVCPSNGTRWAELAGLTVNAPFQLVSTSPGMPGGFAASNPSSTEPGNGTWSSGTEILTLDLVAPSAGGTYSLAGTLSVGG